MALNKNINEAYPAFVGGGNAVQNGKTNTQPSSDMVSPQNIENSTLGGSEAVVSDTRHMFDFVNGKGDYGVFGRDFSYSISSLALVNPYAAGAVVGVLGAGSLIYGIMTSAYVRSKQTLRRLRTIRKKVLSEDGYPIDNMNSFGFMKFLNFFTNWIGGDDKRVGVTQFYDEIKGTIVSLEKELNSLGLNSVGQVDNLTPGGYEQKRSGISKVLNASYKDFYIASGEVNKASDRYSTLLSNNRFKYDKNVEESYDKLMKRMQESNVNAPLYKRRDEYAAQINELGESLVNAFDTKMGYALKRGGNRAISCSKKLHATWKEMMKEISGKLDEKIDEFCVDSSRGLTKAQEIRNIIEALYKKEAFPLTIDSLANELYVGSIFMYRPDSATDGAPVLLSVGDYDKVKWENGLIVMKIVNSDIFGGGVPIDVPIKYVDDYIDSNRDKSNKKSFNIGKRRTTDKFVRMKEVGPGSVKSRHWYRVNYRGSEGLSAANGMWTAVVYVIGIVDGGVYGTPGTQYVQYRYVNFPTYGAKGGGTLQVCEKGVFEDWMISELEEYSDINANESFGDFYDGYSVLNEYGNAIYEDDETDIDNSSSDVESSSENGEKSTNATDSNKPKNDRKETEEERDRKDIEARYNASDNKKSKKLTLEGAEKGIRNYLNKIGSAEKGVYVLLATEDRPIVYTKNPIPGRVELYEKYKDKDSFTWEEWEKLCPSQIPFESSPYDNSDLNDILLDDGVDDIKDYGNYPLTYGAFAKLYMQPKYMFKYTDVFSKNSKELTQYDIIVDKKTKRCTGLCKSNLDAMCAKDSLRISANFKTYLLQCIASETFIKDDEDMKQILADSSTTNESFSIKDIKRLFEGREQLFEKKEGIVTSTSPSEPKSVGQSGNNNIVINENNNKIYQGLSVEDVAKLFGLMLQYGAIGATPQKLQQLKKETDEYKDASVVEEVKKEPIEGIPDIVRKVCIEILRALNGFTKKYDAGFDRTKFNNPPRIFRGIKFNVEELLSGSHNDEYGILSISDISNNVKHSDSNVKLLNPKWIDAWVVDEAYADKHEPVFYFSKYSGSSTNDKDSEVKEYIFFVRDKAVVVSDIKKFDEKLSLKCDGVVQKNSDQDVADDLKKANISFGEYYELPIDTFNQLFNNKGETHSNESVYSDANFYKLFEDDTNASSEAPVSASGAKTVLVMSNSIKDGNVEFKYVHDGSLMDAYAPISVISKTDMESFKYNIRGDIKMLAFDEYLNDIILMNDSGYNIISKFVRDKTGISKREGGILVSPYRSEIRSDSKDFNVLTANSITFCVGNTSSDVVPLLYIYEMSHRDGVSFTKIDWMSKIYHEITYWGVYHMYFKMTKSDFDRSFGVIVSDNGKNTENAHVGMEQDNNSYYYDTFGLHSLNEEDTVSSNGGGDTVTSVYVKIVADGPLLLKLQDSQRRREAFCATYKFSYKTDVQFDKREPESEEYTFTFDTSKFPEDILIEKVEDAEFMINWDDVHKKEETDKDMSKYKPYPERAIRPYSEKDYNNILNLKKYMKDINLSNDSSVSDEMKASMINLCIEKYSAVNKLPVYRNIGDYAKKIKNMIPSETYKIGEDSDKGYYEFIMYIIDKFLSEDWTDGVNLDVNSVQFLMYVNDKGKWKKEKIKVDSESDDTLYISTAPMLGIGKKYYSIPRRGYNYMIIESEDGYPTLRYKDDLSYMKHVLYNVPLNESLIFDFGNPKYFDDIMRVLIDDKYGIYTIMVWAYQHIEELKHSYNGESDNMIPDTAIIQNNVQQSNNAVSGNAEQPIANNTNSSTSVGQDVERPIQNPTVNMQNQNLGRGEY